MGFKPKHKIETVTAPAEIVPFEEGAEPFEARVRTTLSRKELDTFKPGERGWDWETITTVCAPYVVAWNLDDPPPAEAGPDAFDSLTPEAVMWLAGEMGRLIAQQASQAAKVSKLTTIALTTDPDC